jgi:peptidylprolyl isomerase
MPPKWPIVSAPVLIAALAFACTSGGGGEGTPETSPTLAPTPKAYAERPPITIDAEKKYFATVETTKGTFRIQLRPDIAIETVNSFVFLAREGFYNGVTFHRVIPGFVAQGGDPTGTGSGDPGYTLPAEFSDVPFERATVGMARANDPNSGGSQFFVAYADQPGLNGQYTVFGKVVDGMDVVDSLTPRDPQNLATPQPEGDRIISITIEEE